MSHNDTGGFTWGCWRWSVCMWDVLSAQFLIFILFLMYLTIFFQRIDTRSSELTCVYAAYCQHYFWWKTTYILSKSPTFFKIALFLVERERVQDLMKCEFARGVLSACKMNNSFDEHESGRRTCLIGCMSEKAFSREAILCVTWSLGHKTARSVSSAKRAFIPSLTCTLLDKCVCSMIHIYIHKHWHKHRHRHRHRHSHSHKHRHRQTYVCIFICMCIYIYIYIYAYIHVPGVWNKMLGVENVQGHYIACVYIYIYIYMHTFMYLGCEIRCFALKMYKDTISYTYIYIYTYIHIHIYVHICIYIPVYMQICICIYIYR